MRPFPTTAPSALPGLTQLVTNALIPAVGEMGLFGMVTSPGPSPLLPLGVTAVGVAALCSSCWSLGASPMAVPPSLGRERARGTMLVFASTSLQALFPILTLAYAGLCVFGLARIPAPTPAQSEALGAWAVLTGVNATALLGMVAWATLRAWRSPRDTQDRT